MQINELFDGMGQKYMMVDNIYTLICLELHMTIKKSVNLVPTPTMFQPLLSKEEWKCCASPSHKISLFGRTGQKSEINLFNPWSLDNYPSMAYILKKTHHGYH